MSSGFVSKVIQLLSNLKPEGGGMLPPALGDSHTTFAANPTSSPSHREGNSWPKDATSTLLSLENGAVVDDRRSSAQFVVIAVG